MLSTEKTFLLLSIIVLTLSVLACGGGSEPDTPPPSLPTVPPESDAPSAPAAALEGEPTVLGECEDGMTLHSGEGCHYSGEEGRPADLVIYAGTDGSICRDKGSVMMSGLMLPMVRACGDEYEVIDVLEAAIYFRPNGDGSWSVTVSQ